MSNRVRVGDKVTIYPRGKKKLWQAEFHYQGQHCRKSLKTSNKKEALRRARKLEVELDEGNYQQRAPSMAPGEAAEEYVRHLRTENRAPKTLTKYEGVFQNWNEFLEGQRIRRLDSVTLRHFDLFREKRKAEGRHLKTLYTEGSIIKQLFRWAKTRKLVLNNPLEELILSKPILNPKAGPSLEQINAILQHADGDLSLLLAVLAFTGMRSGELQRLRKTDLDLEGNWLHIVSRVDGPTKTKQSRKVPLHPRLRSMLESLPKHSKPWLFTAAPSKKYPAGDHHLNTKHLNERFRRLLQNLGLPVGREEGFTIHSLRHSFETITVNASIPQRVVDAWLGHASDRSMAAVYYKLSDEDSQRFIQQVPFGLDNLKLESELKGESK